MQERPPNATYAYIGAFVDELSRSGLRHVCICPGSRSTPLAIAVALHPGLKTWMHLDERSAAFFALGLAKASRQPVAILSTSGTAAANFMPAVVEAHMAHVPLVVLTADRPPELRDIGAPQTIDQIRFYGSYVKWSVEMATPGASDQLLRYARTTACRAVATALAGPRGPVHLNFPLREPLVPVDAPEEIPANVSGVALYGRADGKPYVSPSQLYPGIHLQEPPDRSPGIHPGESHGSPSAGFIPLRPRSLPVGMPASATLLEIAQAILAAPAGLIVCGPLDDEDLGEAVTALASAAGYPILADPLSGLRAGGHDRTLIVDAYDAFLRVDSAIEDLPPTLVLRFGAMPTSKPLLQYLQRHDSCRQIVIAQEGWQDPTLLAEQMIDAEPADFCACLANVLVELPAFQARPAGTSRWLRDWLETNRRARAALSATLAATDELFEGRVFAELSQLLPAGTTLWAGSSMPVRDLDTFFPAIAQPVRMLANRGANGIDGVVSSALGAAAAASGPTVLAIGDISFYHDMNGLLAAARHHLNLTVVLLNNDGGGIFSFLPQASEPALMGTTSGDDTLFEQLFGTPHGLDFAHAAALYGAVYTRVVDWQGFRRAVREGIAGGGLHIVEVPTDRQRNVALHRRCWPAVAGALEQG